MPNLSLRQKYQQFEFPTTRATGYLFVYVFIHSVIHSFMVYVTTFWVIQFTYILLLVGFIPWIVWNLQHKIANTTCNLINDD